MSSSSLMQPGSPQISEKQLEHHDRHIHQQPCVYLSNLPVGAYEGTIRHAFEAEGINVARVQLLKKGSSNRQRNSGLACVTLTAPVDVQRSCELLDGKVLLTSPESPADGRPLIVRSDKFADDQPGYVSPKQQH